MSGVLGNRKKDRLRFRAFGGVFFFCVKQCSLVKNDETRIAVGEREMPDGRLTDTCLPSSFFNGPHKKRAFRGGKLFTFLGKQRCLVYGFQSMNRRPKK